MNVLASIQAYHLWRQAVRPPLEVLEAQQGINWRQEIEAIYERWLVRARPWRIRW